MDSKDVSREVKRIIWPALESVGFKLFSTRSAWRHSPDCVDVVEFQSFNRHIADALGVTTFSFAVNLGKSLSYIPSSTAVKKKKGEAIPDTSLCHFRGGLASGEGAATKDPTIWSIDETGKNLELCMQDVLHQLPRAHSWFARLDNRAEVLRILIHEPEQMDILWGFGNIPSPIRSRNAGFTALALGDESFARVKLQEAVDSRCFTREFVDVNDAIVRASGMRT